MSGNGRKASSYRAARRNDSRGSTWTRADYFRPIEHRRLEHAPVRPNQRDRTNLPRATATPGAWQRSIDAIAMRLGIR